jgi:hypothetical protein
VRRERRRKNQNIQIFLFRIFTLFVLNPYGHFNFLRLIVFSFQILTLTWSFVRSIASNLLKLSNIHVSWFDNNIRLHYLFYSSHCPFLMTTSCINARQNDHIRLFSDFPYLIKSLPFFNDNKPFSSKMIGFWPGVQTSKRGAHNMSFNIAYSEVSLQHLNMFACSHIRVCLRE